MSYLVSYQFNNKNLQPNNSFPLNSNECIRQWLAAHHQLSAKDSPLPKLNDSDAVIRKITLFWLNDLLFWDWNLWQNSHKEASWHISLDMIVYLFHSIQIKDKHRDIIIWNYWNLQYLILDVTFGMYNFFRCHCSPIVDCLSTKRQRFHACYLTTGAFTR